jgi:hypothetical protein
MNSLYRSNFYVCHPEGDNIQRDGRVLMGSVLIEMNRAEMINGPCTLILQTPTAHWDVNALSMMLTG